MPVNSSFHPQLTSKTQTGITSAKQIFKQFCLMCLYILEYSEEPEISNHG